MYKSGHLIDFPTKMREPDFYATDFTKLFHANHLSLWEKTYALFCIFLQKSNSLYDLRTGDIRGKTFGDIPRYKYILAGTLYSCIALFVVLFAV